ncbi:hypothetical protein PLICRDRAFT_699296 [Plicaturopsis crispa FD-325 SS-3]|nr:hypothetical protein PLICRDRAFT_699296 [Plicaturopsis crispa FD-325 SS-3]
MARFGVPTSDSSDSDDDSKSSSNSSQQASSHRFTGRPHVNESEDEEKDEEDEDEDEDEEDEDGDDDSEDDSEDSSESSESSDMHEDELVASPPRKQKPTPNALVEDEDGDIRFAHEIERRPLAVSRTRGDPTLVPWAQQVGVDAQRMHVMQTSLFRMPEEAAALRAMNQPISRPHLLPQALNRKHSRDSDGDLRIDAREVCKGVDVASRASFAHDLEPPVYRPSRKYARVEGSDSVANGSEGFAVDAGLALGRSFRVGWGPGGTLVHLGQICGPSGNSKTSANSSIISKTTLPVFASPTSEEDNRFTKLLQHHLTNSPIEPDADGIPFANPSSDLDFASFSNLYLPTDRSYEASLFRLGHCLFDEIDLRLSDTVTVDIRNRITSLRRKAALSSWLEEIVAPSVDVELRENLSATSAAVAFTHLTGNQIEKACEAAMDGGNVKLATLISQAGGDLEFRADLKEQLTLWQEQRIDVHIDEGVRKVYALLSGILDVVEGSKGASLERCSDIDVASGLDWKRTLGLHLWFSEPMDTSIAQVFQSYDRLWRDSPERIAAPLPSYSQSSSQWKLPTSKPPPDALFSLIRLHAEPACSLSQILSPFSFGASPVDYSLPWHLYIVLSRCMRVRDFSDRGDPGPASDDGDDDDESRVEGHSPSADLLASSYAFQLEQLGMLQEALFVLLHIEGPAGRKKAVMEMLSRNAPKLYDPWMVHGVAGSLLIPMAWVDEAKAIHAFDNGRVYEAYELYLSARLFNQAHELAVLELAPDAVIRQDLDLLSELFAKIAGQPVNGWHIRGKAFLDYVHIMNRLPELHAQLSEHDAVPDASQALELEELTRSIPKLIGILPDVLRDRADPRHNAALAEMIAGLMLRLDKVKPLALSQTQVRPTLVDEATRLRHIHSTAYERFMKTIEAV